MKKVLKWLGILFTFLIVVAIIDVIIEDIVIFIGLAILGYGIYKWRKNKKSKIRSKVPITLIVLGLIITFSGAAASDDMTESQDDVEQETEIVENEENQEQVKDENTDKNEDEKEQDKESSPREDTKKENNINVVKTPAKSSSSSKTASENKTSNKAKNVSKKDDAAHAKKLGLAAATVKRVIDGDTIELSDGSRVRLIGVNAPESTTRTEEYGKEASNYTKSKLEGKKVWLQKDVSETDRYGRLLRLVWLSVPTDVMKESEIRSKMFNADLVLNGYAQVSTYPPDVTYADYFRKFEREARENNTGLWAIDPNGTTKGDFNKSNTTASSSSSSSSKNSKSSASSNSTSKNVNKPTSSNKNSGSSKSSSTKSKDTGGDPSSGYYVIPGAPTHFKNCDEMRKYYPNGVHESHPAYAPARDRDKDGWACER